MFSYRLIEKEKTCVQIKFKNSEAASEAASNGWDESNSVVEDHHVPSIDARSFTSDVKSVGFDMKSTFTEVPDRKIPSELRSVRSEPADKKLLLIKKTTSVKVRKVPGKVYLFSQCRFQIYLNLPFN
jgi:hypothetical protein